MIKRITTLSGNSWEVGDTGIFGGQVTSIIFNDNLPNTGWTGVEDGSRFPGYVVEITTPTKINTIQVPYHAVEYILEVE